MSTIEIDPGTQKLYRIGGISATLFGLGYLAIIAVYIRIGAPPNGVEERLAYLARHTNAWWLIVVLCVSTDLLFVPVVFVLYVALRNVSKNLMLFAIVCVALFIGLDLALTWTNYATLITLSGEYARSASQAERAAIVTAATYPTEVLKSGLLFFYNSFILAVGLLLIGLAMLRSVFGRGIAYLGIITGVLGIISVVGPHVFSVLKSLIILDSALITVWVFIVGYKLLRLASR